MQNSENVPKDKLKNSFSETDYQLYIKHLAKILDEVLTFEITRKAKFYYKTANEYKVTLNNFYNQLDNNRSLSRLVEGFHYDKEFYSKIIGTRVCINGKLKKYTHDVINILKETSQHLVFIGKKDAKYKSGLKFSHRSFIVIKNESINMLFNDKSFGNAQSEFYSKTSKNLIHQKLLETVMTNKQKEQYIEEYKAGKHALTLEDHIKFLQKQKREKEKRQMTIAKKAVREVLAEYNLIQLTENTKPKTTNSIVITGNTSETNLETEKQPTELNDISESFKQDNILEKVNDLFIKQFKESYNKGNWPRKAADEFTKHFRIQQLPLKNYTQTKNLESEYLVKLIQYILSQIETVNNMPTEKLQKVLSEYTKRANIFTYLSSLFVNTLNKYEPEESYEKLTASLVLF